MKEKGEVEKGKNQHFESSPGKTVKRFNQANPVIGPIVSPLVPLSSFAPQRLPCRTPNTESPLCQ